MIDAPITTLGDLTGWNTFTTTGSSTLDVPKIEEILAFGREWRAKQKEIDDRMIAGLNKMIDDSGRDIFSWAETLRMNVTDLSLMLVGKCPPSGYLWDQLARVFQRVHPSTERYGR